MDDDTVRFPDPEPKPPNDVFRIRVSYPYIAPEAKGEVLKTIEKGDISSATNAIDKLEDELVKYYKVSSATVCNSGYSALVIALKLARVGVGDEVLIPAFTMVAVANAVLTVGAKPVFVDCAPGGEFNPTATEYGQKLTPQCRALIVTHTYGVPADCLELQQFCKSHDLAFIEDIAEAIGTEYKGQLVGTFGDFACASLYANKTITAGDGGFVLINRPDEGLKERAKSYTNHGFSSRYHFVHFEASGNYKLSGLQAAFVKPAVARIGEVMLDRNRIATLYRRALVGTPGVDLMPVNPYGMDAPWMFGVIVKSKETRTHVRKKLAAAGIETRDYFFPLHLQPMMSKLQNTNLRSLPRSEVLGSRGFYLPTYFGLSDARIQEICEVLKTAVHDQ